jgi:hypothetical protein
MHKIRQKICNNCGLRYSAESLRNVFAKNCNWKINICLAIEALAELALAGSAIFFCVNARDTSYGFHQQISQQSTTKKKRNKQARRWLQRLNNLFCSIMQLYRLFVKQRQPSSGLDTISMRIEWSPQELWKLWIYKPRLDTSRYRFFFLSPRAALRSASREVAQVERRARRRRQHKNC